MLMSKMGHAPPMRDVTFTDSRWMRQFMLFKIVSTARQHVIDTALIAISLRTLNFTLS